MDTQRLHQPPVDHWIPMNDKRMKLAMIRALAAVAALPKPTATPTVKPVVDPSVQAAKLAAAQAKRERRAAKHVK